MRRGLKSQSRVRHQRAVGRYHLPYQRGGTIFSPRNLWAMPSYQTPSRMLRRVRQKADKRAKQKGGRVHKVTYPWAMKGRKSI